MTRYITVKLTEDQWAFTLDAIDDVISNLNDFTLDDDDIKKEIAFAERLYRLLAKAKTE